MSDEREIRITQKTPIHINSKIQRALVRDAGYAVALPPFENKTLSPLRPNIEEHSPQPFNPREPLCLRRGSIALRSLSSSHRFRTLVRTRLSQQQPLRDWHYRTPFSPRPAQTTRRNCHTDVYCRRRARVRKTHVSLIQRSRASPRHQDVSLSQ